MLIKVNLQKSKYVLMCGKDTEYPEGYDLNISKEIYEWSMVFEQFGRIVDELNKVLQDNI